MKPRQWVKDQKPCKIEDEAGEGDPEAKKEAPEFILVSKCIILFRI
jgi:hypothetical protein